MMRQLAKAGWDCGAWLAAIGLVVGARYGFGLAPEQINSVIQYAISVCVLQVTAGAVLKVYRRGFRTGSFEESFWLACATGVAAVVPGFGLFALRGLDDFPRGLALLAPPIALLIIAAGRLGYREWRLRHRKTLAEAQKVLIYGAGDLGHMLVRLIETERPSPYQAVGLIDDDRSKRHLRLGGIPVRGRRQDLVRVARETGASIVILGIGDADRDLIKEIEQLTRRAGLTLKVVPHVSRLIDGHVTLGDVRDVQISDLLGRRQIHTDMQSICDYVARRRVLVTGAGGSIGSELARQAHHFGPSELILLDRDESALHAVQLSIYGKALLDTPDMVLADVRDADALRTVFERHRPEVVFHAAALKHLPMLEQYPDEGWKTNVLGTRNLLELSVQHGVRQFVNISTDKAADPTSTLGWTKRQAERLTAWYAANTDGVFLSVRFGNVLGSRGSMLETFRTQIEQGGPVTVTHPDVTRYFMTIPEACELVIQAGAIGGGGEVLVLDMGEPVRILDVAERLIARSGKTVDLVFTGLRPGEKLHESLFSAGETGKRLQHPLIWQVPVPPTNPLFLEESYQQWSSRRGSVRQGGPLPKLQIAGA